MTSKPNDGGVYFQDEEGRLIKLEEDQVSLDPVTRELALASPAVSGQSTPRDAES